MYLYIVPLGFPRLGPSSRDARGFPGASLPAWPRRGMARASANRGALVAFAACLAPAAPARSSRSLSPCFRLVAARGLGCREGRARETCRLAAGSADGEGPHRPRGGDRLSRARVARTPRQHGGEGACARQVRPEMRRRSEEEIGQSAFTSRPVYPRAEIPEAGTSASPRVCRGGRPGGVGARLLAEAPLLAAL
jgi:hypothetical protein